MSLTANTTAVAEDAIIATKVSDDKRMEFLPEHFGQHHPLGERLVYLHMRQLCSDYSGGFWHFYTTSNGGFYLAPESDGKPMHLSVASNWFDGDMSADAAGIVATIFALSHFIAERNDLGATDDELSMLVDRYHALRDFAACHAERKSIYRAID